MDFWRDVDTGEKVPSVLNAIVKVPHGSRNKYDLQPGTGRVILELTFPGDAAAPCEYAFVPRTLWDDSKPLKVFVLTEQGTVPSCLIRVRPIGFLNAHIDNANSDKIIAVPADDPHFSEVKDIKDVPKSTLADISSFLETLCKAQNRKLKTGKWEGEERAKAAVLHAIELFNRRFG